MPDGRFAPSPTGTLHLGNLRTALLAWLFARSSASRFLLRMEDLDGAVSRPEHEAGQLADLAAIGLDWDGEMVRQSERRSLYHDAMSTLDGLGLTYACWCSRREIREAASAPNGSAADGAYPGTCRSLTAAESAHRAGSGRTPALRLRCGGATVAFDDRQHGRIEGVVDDFVLRRGDGTPSYNLAVVVDDADQGIGEVVRGDDLLSSTPRQVHLAGVLGLAVPTYAHVPLALGPTGARLAKRDGSVTLADRAALGQAPDDVRSVLAASLGLAEPGEPVTPNVLVRRLDPESLPRTPWRP